MVTDFSFLPSLESEDWLLPFQGCCSLSFAKLNAPVSLSDDSFNIFPGYGDQYEIPNDLYNFYYDLFCGGKHKLRGYPNFIQQDPRSQWNKDRESLVLLFQMGSANSKAINIMWADGGIGNFFIDKSKLSKLDFSEVFYHWDCS